MKKVNVILFCICILLLGCTEKNSLINFGTSTSSDTTYLAPIEIGQQKNVLIEEFTGVSCPPCPGGHEIVKNLKTKYPNRIIVIANHVYNFPQAAPIKDLSKYDFRTQDATEIGNLFGGVGSMPIAVIDRVQNNNDYFTNSGNWPVAVDVQMKAKSPVNLYLTSTFDQVVKKATVKVKIAYTQALDKPHALGLAIIENEIVDAQKNQLLIDTFYAHNYVLRDFVTPVSGKSIIDSLKVKEAGRVVEQKFEVHIKDDWKVDNCKVIAFIYSRESGKMDVYQTLETAIK